MLPRVSAFVIVIYFLANTPHGVNGLDINVNKHPVSVSWLLNFLQMMVKLCGYSCGEYSLDLMNI